MFRQFCRGLLIFAITASPGLLPAESRSAAKSPGPPPILPADFAGWQLSGAARVSATPDAADARNTDVLKEDGFAEFVAGSYVRGGEKLSVRAIRFEDASGAYSAYTFYRRPGMPREDIGDGGAFDGTRVLFWKGTTVVDATFDHLTAMSAAELRDLAAGLPKPVGNTGTAPPLPGYLPEHSLDHQTTRYALGPLGYERGGGLLPAALVDFNRGAEAITARYSIDGEDGTLTLISYPTPQVAADRERAIGAFLTAGNTPQASWPAMLATSSPAALQTRRSGTLVAVTSGGLSANAAKKLLSEINYTADVTWNHPQGYISEASKTARLMLGIFTLCGILGGAAILLGIFLGGGRALFRRMRGKPVSSVTDDSFITLHLRE